MNVQNESPKARARIACVRCNTRKTRCISDGAGPCRTCLAGGHDCVLIESLRGNLTYVLNDVLAPFLGNPSGYRSRLHHPIPTTDQDGRSKVCRQKEFLTSLGNYFMPESIHLEHLLDIYLTWFHPAYPVIDPDQMKQGVASETFSLLLLHAVLLVAVTVCDNTLLSAAVGTADRYKARQIFFKQAKSLYDEDLEPHQTDLVASIFLMSFWWDKPDDPKDTWHWLGVSASLAQSLGMHRSRWKKIWWSIRIREALVSGSIGRPQHVSESDCDLELLDEKDFPTAMTSLQQVHTVYACRMARLSQIMTDIIKSRYSAGSKSRSGALETLRLKADLQTFRADLPGNLTYRGFCDDTKSDLWKAMIVVAYNYAVLLLCRPSRRNGTDGQSRDWGDSEEAARGANEVTRVVEDILSAGIGQYCQIFTIPAVFNALAMHLYTMCSGHRLERELAENRVRTCMLGLQVLESSWPVGSWVYRLFVHNLDIPEWNTTNFDMSI
ncbi:hypothetical protein BDZ85DRAFT_272687 [Elsinoe ampelina]|uniref:Xylanolytic transcriptional activator regulatory domain-containing protein n=1 Tax=Elsinoe ampelina TaxID=302913 RepID=A0A6A6GLA8_9PEZI|nr:hypothetical protein BDZ85DRAFT_272687 [Elsinoe ampelina]